MPRPRADMRKIREVLRLALGEELSQRLVSAASGVPQTTVHDYLVRAAAAGLKWPLPGDLDDAGLEALLYPPVLPAGTARPAPDWQQVHAEMRKKGVTLQLLWVEYREAHPGDGYGYSQFANLYRSWRDGIDVSMRQAHAPGEKLFADFPGGTFPVHDPATGQIAVKAGLFVAVPGASGYLYAKAFPSRELQYWVTAHVRCFEAPGGCPAIVVSDNLRSAVTRADRYEPGLNATFAEMAARYGVAVIAARPCKPKDKPKAESGVLLAERWIIARLRGRKFTSLGEASAAIAGCAAEINARPFQKLDGSGQELFGQLDRPALRPLPATRYEFATWRKARVSIDYHIAADRHYYSVPYRLARQPADVRLPAATVEVFRRGQRVASHPRPLVRHAYTTDPAHMPGSRRQHAQRTPQKITEWAARTGPSTAALAEAILASRSHPEQGYRAVPGIIRLASRYGTGRVEAARARALRLRAYSYRSVNSILSTGLDRQPLPGEGPVISPHPAHGNLRAPGCYQQEGHPVMLGNPAIGGLKTLRLHAMAAGLAEQHEQAGYAGLSFEDRLGLLADRELADRASRRITRSLKTGCASPPPSRTSTSATPAAWTAASCSASPARTGPGTAAPS